jgi:hypothetical protein
MFDWYRMTYGVNWIRRKKYNRLGRSRNLATRRRVHTR